MEREVYVMEMECPFCGHKDFLKTKDEIHDESGFRSGHFYDAWDCTCCGERTELDHGAWKEEFKEFKYYTQNNDWDGLLCFCQSEEFDEVALLFLAKCYLAKKEWGKAEKIAAVMLKINPEDFDAEIIFERIKKKDSKIRINVTANELIDAFQLCNFDRLYFLDLKNKELVSYAPNLNTIEEALIQKNIENNPPDFLKIPFKKSKEKLNLMESFIHEIGEHHGQTKTAEILTAAIKKSEPLRNFRDTLLNYPKVNEQWLAFERNVDQEIVLDWVCEYNLICKVEGEK